MKKQILCAALLVATLVPSSALALTPESVSPASDNSNSAIEPRYAHLVSASPSLNVSGTTAEYSLNATGRSNVTRMTAQLQIQKKNSSGTFVNYDRSWSVEVNGRSLYTSGTKTVEKGGTYRLKATIALMDDSTGEFSTEYVYSYG